MKWISTELLYRPTVRKHFILVLVGFLFGILVYGFINFDGFQYNGELLLSGLLGIVLSYCLHSSNGLIDRFFPWKRQPGFRLLFGILIQMGMALIVVFGFLWGYRMLLGTSALFFETDDNDIKAKIGILLFCSALIYNVVYFAYYSYSMYSKGQVMEVQLKRKQTELQLNALKSQLSPHFLFNSMNTLSSLFQKDTEKAETFIRSLAGSYEYVLNTYEVPLVTIAEELKFVRAYCFLMRTRFGEYLHLDVQLPDASLQGKVPPMTLQMLVENAVKHNVMGPSLPLKIQIKPLRDGISVSNNKTRLRPKIESMKIGLQNIAARYELLANKPILVRDATDFSVEIPILG